MTALLPTVERRYFRVDEKSVSPVVLARIQETYRELLAEKAGIFKNPSGMDLQKVVVPAFTRGKDTLLFPEFFRDMTDEISQSSVLFHEGLWVRFPPKKEFPTLEEYRQVLNTDIAFERWWRKTDRIAVYHFLDQFYWSDQVAPMSIEIRGYEAEDVASKVFGDVVDDKDTVPMTFFTPDCHYGDRTHLLDLAKHYPDSYVVALLLKNPWITVYSGWPEEYQNNERVSLFSYIYKASYGNAPRAMWSGVSATPSEGLGDGTVLLDLDLDLSQYY